MDIRRFGVGHRRPQGPAGSVGLTGGPIHADEHGRIAELVLARHGRLELHSAPMPAWLLVIEGGGWVQVGDERARIAAGEAVCWPADVVRGLWTEGSELRAFIVEFGAGVGAVGVVEPGAAEPGVVEPGAEPATAVLRGPVRVADRGWTHRPAPAPDEGEPY
jgi:quercetin dioxygenase-like cupin family protein